MKEIYVTFADLKLEKDFESLESKKSENKELYKNINNAIQKIKKNPNSGIKISKKLWPKKYVQKYSINNLFKFNLPQGWRLIYTIKADDVMILNIILEWLPHKEYEQRFNY